MRVKTKTQKCAGYYLHMKSCAGEAILIFKFKLFICLISL